MTSNSPRSKSFTFETSGVIIFYPGKEGLKVVIFHLTTLAAYKYGNGKKGKYMFQYLL